jgi:PRC-barrel domain
MAFIHYTRSHAARPSSFGIVGADCIMRSNVVDRQGQSIGEVREIMLDLSSGRIAYVVIALRSTGAGDHLIVVPWNAVHPDRGADQLRIDAHADWIKRGPTVQPDYANRFVQDWGAFIHNYFGTRPYWEPASTSQYA